MKIALTTRHYNKQGGISRYVAELAERFAKNHEVHVYTTEWKDVGNKDVIFHKVPTIHGPLVVNSIPFTIQNTLRFKLLRSKYDLIHINGGESLCQDVITAHSIHKAGIEFRNNNRHIQGLGFHDLYALTTEKINYSGRNYKKIIADSTSSKEELMKCYDLPSEDIVVIPLGVDLDEYKPIKKGKLMELRIKYGLKDDDIVLLIVATEFFRKGMVELISALGILRKKITQNIKLLIVGEAKTEGSIKGTDYYIELSKNMGVAKDVIFTGHVNDLNSYYNMADIFVFPTKYEAFGIPTLEAMAAGLPVLNSKIGAGELITNGIDGIHLDNPNDIKEIADKLEMLINDEKLRRFIGNNARKTAMKYSWDKTAKMTMDVYKEIIE